MSTEPERDDVREPASAQAPGTVDERIAVLSTYLGHVSPADTYWYLTATPGLMQLAADRLDRRFGAQS